jgi:UDP-N-acetylglucosamine acyltransferase
MDRSNVTHYGRRKNWKNCNIFPGAVAVPQDLKFGGEDSLAIIGDNCTIRECVTINRGTIASGQTTLGNNCLVMATAHIV